MRDNTKKNRDMANHGTAIAPDTSIGFRFLIFDWFRHIGNVGSTWYS
tara:strand:+ start:283 stop:423 length:141 start_codon:yes stop_codon:yes gene_type:complete